MTSYNQTPPPDELRDRFFYKDGDLWWNPDYKHHRINYDRPLGFIHHKTGHKVIRLSGRNYKIARLIYWFVKGEWPQEVDHIDRNPLNNHIENLRPATRLENARNRNADRQNETGYVGVYKTYCSTWGASIALNGKKYTISGYETALQAALARDMLARIFYGDFCKLNVLDKDIRLTESDEMINHRKEIHRKFIKSLENINM
ncbi:hypothetical protein F3W96_19770 [Salmonella enterica]|nr:hypothetical protein [Salmonella enterica subsp. enterica serovar Sandiego]